MSEKRKPHLSPDWRTEITDPTTQRVLAALENTDAQFRTAATIALETELSVDVVKDVLRRNKRYARESRALSPAAERLYQARSYRRTLGERARELGATVRMYITHTTR